MTDTSQLPSDLDRAPRGCHVKTIGRMLSASIMLGAGILCLLATRVYVREPETDDATVRANFIGIAPHASGHVVELPVRDNQSVREGDLLFVIDPRPYEHAVALAKARLALTRKEVAALQKAVQVAEASIGRAEAQVNASTADIARAEAQSIAAEASVERAQGQFKEANNHFHRLEPLLPKELTTPDLVEAAETRRLVAETGVREAQKALIAARSVVQAARAQNTAAEAALEQAKAERLRAEDAVGQEGNFNARISQAEAQLAEAELDLSYCYVRAPFAGKVVNLNISVGEFGHAGVQVFTLVDTRTWYVVANFRETQLRQIAEGSPAEVFLQFTGGKRFHGRVVGPGWAVIPEYGTSTLGLPNVPRNLDWVRLAQRFPVRVQIDNPDDTFRMGASAVVRILGPAPAQPAAKPIRASL
jgi:multidrug efflux system membrane fusion protein